MIYKLAQIEDEYKVWIDENEDKARSNGKKRGETFFSIIILCENVEITQKRNSNYEIWNSTREIKELKKVFSEARGEFFLVVDRPGILEDKMWESILDADVENEARLIYSDEDCLIDGRRCAPFFKPDWSPHTLQSFFYIGSAVAYRRELMERLLEQQTERWDNGRISEILAEELKREQVLHIPKILYHNMDEIKIGKEAQKKERKMEQDKLVSIIIPSKDHPDILKRCIDSIQERTDERKYEIIVVDNGSCEENHRKIKDYLQKMGAKYLYEKQEFNFSRMCNRGATEAEGGMLLFLNDDTEILKSDWLERMLELAILPYSGAVGAKLLYPGEKKIQHVGIVNLQSGPSHAFLGEEDGYCYFGRNIVNYNYIAVTGACLMIEKRKYWQVGGMDECFPIAYNDVDLCFKLYKAGFYNVVCNETKLLHYESLSRGLDAYDEEKIQRLLKERARLFEKHPNLRGEDPFYNRNLITNKENFSLNIPRHRLEKVNSLFWLGKRRCNELKVEIDFITYDENITIEGWCLSENREEEDIERKLVVKMARYKFLLLDVEFVDRADVQQVMGCVRSNLGFRVVIPAALKEIVQNAVGIGMYEQIGERGRYFAWLEPKLEWERWKPRELEKGAEQKDGS